MQSLTNCRKRLRPGLTDHDYDEDEDEDEDDRGFSEISRELRCPDRYDQSHCVWTRNLFWSCGSASTCSAAHTHQVTKPLLRKWPTSRIAKFLPTTAILPLLRYRNGRPSLCPLTRLAMTCPTNRPF